MLDQLRDTVLRPLVEVLLLIPLPWRPCVDVFLILLIIYLLPPGRWVSPFIWLVHLLMGMGISITLGMQRLVANRRQSWLIDTIDWVFERDIQGFGSAQTFLKSRLSGLKKWGRPKKLGVVLVSLLPAALWFGRPPLGNITVGRAIDTGFARLIVAEQWALSGKWMSPRMEVNKPITDTGKPAESTNNSQNQLNSSGAELVHVVRQGEMLRDIARQYGVRIQCVIDINQPRFNNFNPNSLYIGMQLIIPEGVPNCRQS